MTFGGKNLISTYCRLLKFICKWRHNLRANAPEIDQNWRCRQSDVVSAAVVGRRRPTTFEIKHIRSVASFGGLKVLFLALTLNKVLRPTWHKLKIGHFGDERTYSNARFLSPSTAALRTIDDTDLEMRWVNSQNHKILLTRDAITECQISYRVFFDSHAHS